MPTHEPFGMTSIVNAECPVFVAICIKCNVSPKQSNRHLAFGWFSTACSCTACCIHSPSNAMYLLKQSHHFPPDLERFFASLSLRQSISCASVDARTVFLCMRIFLWFRCALCED
eukprot:610271_1